MAIFVTPTNDGFGGGTGDRVQVGSEIDNAVDAQAAFSRVEPLITVEQLKERYLPGIPLVSPLPDPVTKKKFVFTDDILKDVVRRAANRIETVEMGSGFHVTPVQVRRRHFFDRAEYRQLGFFRMPDRPITRLMSIQVKTADGTPVYNVPIQWADPGQFKRGQINLVPLMPAFIGQGGTLPSFDAGGAAWLSILGQAGWVPSYWELVYITGFEEGHIPSVINEAIGITAAIDVLGKLAALYRIASYSTGLDAASQSVSTPGPALYDKAIERLELEKKAIVSKMKAWYFGRFIVDNV